MAVKAETIEQIGGFGNLIPSSYKEHFRSSGFIKSANGLVAGIKTSVLSTGNPTKFTQSEYASIGNIFNMADGYGRTNIGTQSGANPVTYVLNENGDIYQSYNGGNPDLVVAIDRNNSHFGVSGLGGLITDPKKRLLYSGERYLGMFDPSVSDVFFTDLTFTNGSNAVGSSDATEDFTADMVGKNIRVLIGGTYHYYKIASYIDGFHITISGTFSGTTAGNYTAFVLMSWTNSWKDWGTDFSENSEGNYATTPCETYEDTVLFGRGSNITSLNITSDTITTDASPAFNMPDGYDCMSIDKGSNGILLGFNFQGKGVLLLWDNFSDRSIAPWIELQDRLVSVCKYQGNWLVITTTEILLTNGYSVTTLASNFLDAEHTSYSPILYSKTSAVVGDDFYFTIGLSYNGKRRAGLYCFNLTSKLVTYIPRTDMNQYDNLTRCIFYSNSNSSGGKLMIGSAGSWDYVSKDTESKVSTIVTNPVGSGVNRKIAEALKVDLGISETYYSSDSPFSFDIIAKVFPMTKQKQNRAKLKTAMVTNYNKMTIDETVYPQIPVGSEIEFLSGENAGYTRNVISKTGAGTNTAVLILDRNLPYLQTNTTDYFFFNPFLLIEKKSYTNITEIPETIWFDIKNKIKGKKFMFKIEIENPTVHIELRPMTFIYDDLGVI